MESDHYIGLSDIIDRSKSQLEKALAYYTAGLPVIPLHPGTKKTARKWDKWLDSLSEETIRAYWTHFPDHGIGFIVPPDIVVLDADTTEAVAALYQLEKSLDVTPNLIITTRRGEHHYFRLEPGTVVKTSSINTAEQPAGIDVKAPRSMVVLP